MNKLVSRKLEVTTQLASISSALFDYRFVAQVREEIEKMNSGAGLSNYE